MTGQGEPGELAADAAARAAAYDGLIEAALREKHATLPTVMIDQITTMYGWKASDFVARYQEGSAFPAERLDHLVNKVIDVSLQQYYVIEVDLGLQNTLYYGPLHVLGSSAPSPRMQLIKMSLDQSLIGKTRVLWERLMNLVYYLEFGCELDEAKPKSKSKKGFFFKEMRDKGGQRWRWLLPYEKVIEDYDAKFRTAEFHKNSILRSQFLGMREIDPNDLNILINRFINSVWANLLQTVAGEQVNQFTDLHLLDDHVIDPQYLSSPE
jgi:hypothetical protein